MRTFSGILGNLLSRKNFQNRQAKRARRASGLYLAAEALERRLALSPIITTLNFNVPTDVAAQGVQVVFFGTAVTDANDQSGIPVYLSGTAGNLSWAKVSDLAAGSTLPAITLNSGTNAQVVPLAIPAPNVDGKNFINAGELFMFVGPVHNGAVVNPDHTVAAPSVQPRPADNFTPDNISQLEFTYFPNELDIDSSAIDSTGVPFIINSPVGNPNAPFPLTSLGITLSQSNAVQGYVNAFSAGGIYESAGQYFSQDGQFNPSQVIGPQDILAAESTPPKVLAATSAASGDSAALPGSANQGDLKITLASPLTAPLFAGQKIAATNLAGDAAVAADAQIGDTQVKIDKMVQTTGSDVYTFQPLFFALADQTGSVNGTIIKLSAPLSRMLPAGSAIFGTFMPANTVVTQTAAANATELTISQPALQNGTGTWTFNPPANPLTNQPGQSNGKTLTLNSPLTATIVAGMTVTGTNIPANTIVTSTAAANSTSVQISQAATSDGSGIYTFASQLNLNDHFYYEVTAYSKNAIPGAPAGVVGETLPDSNSPTYAVVTQAGNVVQLAWNKYNDPNTAGYNIYRSTDGTSFSLIAQVPGADVTRYTDIDPNSPAQAPAPPISNYGFNPLSDYFTQDLTSFFNYYQSNDFTIDYSGVKWTGKTKTISGNYTVLQLTAQNGDGHQNGVQAGDVVNIYQPFFSSNTRYLSSTPPMPDWMTNNEHTNPSESPGQMVFGADGVFATKAYDPDVPARDQEAIGGIENAIDSAFNRGIATNIHIQPDNWALFPLINQAPVVAASASSQLAAGTYYYALTTVNSLGESSPSIKAPVVVSGNQSVTLNWLPSGTIGNTGPAVTGYNIYRGTSPASLTLIGTTNATTLTFTDQGGQATSVQIPPFEYFTPGTTSNFYSGYIQSSSSADPAHGVSIYGLSYGFPFSDQGGLSTNLDFNAPNIPASLGIALEPLSGPGFYTQILIDATLGQAYSQSIVATGPNGPFTFSSPDLPTWLKLSSSGVLSGTPDGTVPTGTVTFSVTASDSQSHQSTRKYTLNVVSAPTMSVRNAVAGVVTLPGIDLGSPIPQNYDQFQVAGGVGPFTVVYMSQPLPAGTKLGSMTSQNGAFQVTGTPLAQTSPLGSHIQIQLQDSLNLLLKGHGTVGTRILNLQSTANLAVGMTVAGLGIPKAGAVGSGLFGTYITRILNGNQVELSRNITRSSPAGTPFTFCDAIGNTQPKVTGANPFTLVMTVVPRLTLLNPQHLAAARQNRPYSQQLLVPGNRTTDPVTFSARNLPSWLTLSSQGLLTTPVSQTAPKRSRAIYSFTVTATDLEGNTASKLFKIRVRR